MPHVIIVGCGIIGATIAYELSRLPDLAITLLEQQPEATFFPAAPPVSASRPDWPTLRPVASHAALGILVGISSQKRKGRAWNLRQASIRRYHSLLPELTALTGQPIAHNAEGLLHLLTADANLGDWQALCEQRASQGFRLDRLSQEQLRDRYPDLDLRGVVAGIHSPQDLHIQPAALLRALIAAARQQGVQFHFTTAVEAVEPCHVAMAPTSSSHNPMAIVHTQTDSFSADWVILAAGLGTAAVIPPGQPPVALMPVLGQGIQVRLTRPLAGHIPLPVVTRNDIHIAPLDTHNYWIGATVEFPQPETPLVPDRAQLQTVWEQAIACLPALAEATWVETWYGLRPRPTNQPAPIIEKLAGYPNVILATGHYRNGILLAPATAQQVSTLMGVSLPLPDGAGSPYQGKA